jgi:hypothetical protein
LRYDRYICGIVIMKHFIAMLNKQKCIFFKNEGKESKARLLWGLVPVGGGKT